MNTLGILRGYMTKNMDIDRFIKVVANALSREFNERMRIRKIKRNLYLIKFSNCKIILDKQLLTQLKSPYGIGRYLLEIEVNTLGIALGIM